jgi:hypothetical protein
MNEIDWLRKECARMTKINARMHILVRAIRECPTGCAECKEHIDQTIAGIKADLPAIDAND